MLNVSHEINMNNIVFQSLPLRGDNRLMDQDSLLWLLLDKLHLNNWYLINKKIRVVKS